MIRMHACTVLAMSVMLGASACGEVKNQSPDAVQSIDAMVVTFDAAAPDAAPMLMSITVTPDAASIVLGGTQQYVAMGTYNTGTTDITSLVTWGTGAAGTATITTGGLATGVSINDTTVTASLDGVDGQTSLSVLGYGSMMFPANHCRHVVESGSALGDGQYWIDPSGTDAYEAYCDMSTDGGGWTLVAWNGQTDLGTPVGVPYPGLAPCPDFTCQRGSAADMARMTALIQTGTEFAKAQSATAMATFAPLASYTYAGKYVYGSLAALTLVYGSNQCDPATPFATGTYTSMIGPNTFDGTTVYLAPALGTNAGAPYDYSVDSNIYFWSVATATAACNGCTGTCDVEAYMGTASSTQYGPFEAATGAHSLWVR